MVPRCLSFAVAKLTLKLQPLAATSQAFLISSLFIRAGVPPTTLADRTLPLLDTVTATVTEPGLLNLF